MTNTSKDWFPKSRLEALTDGIYAVALTLLVLDLKISAGQIGAAQLSQALFHQLPNLLTWLLSFWVILIFWESQVRLSRLIDQIDTATLRLDLLHLGLISLLPFSTSLIGEHGDQRLAVLIYTLNLWVISALSVMKIVHLGNTPDVLSINADVSNYSRSAKLMLGGMTVALLLSYVFPGWNLIALLAPKLITRKKVAH